MKMWFACSSVKLCDIDLLLHGLNLEYLSDIMKVKKNKAHIIQIMPGDLNSSEFLDCRYMNGCS